MPYPQLRTGGSKTYSSQLFNTNGVTTFPEGTTFSSMTSDSSIATTSADENGVVTVTPVGDATGNVFITLTAVIPNNVSSISGTILIHIMDAPLSETEFIQLTPVI